MTSVRREKINNKKTQFLRLTLKRVPMEENFADLEDSSRKGGNKLATKEHFEAAKRA